MMCKKIIAMVLSFALALSVGFPSNATVSGNDAITAVEEQELETFEQEPVVEEVYAEEEPALYLAGSSLAEATTIDLDTNYYGTFAENSVADYYKVDLSSSGRLQFDATAKMYRIRYAIYDSQGNKLWSDYYYWNNTTEQSVVSNVYDFTKGTYYFVVEKYGYTGNYEFKLSFTSAKESFVETEYGNDNGISTANEIKVNTDYKGQIAFNDEKDFYKVTLSSSGRLILDATAKIYRIRYTIYDSQGNKLWSNFYYWNDTTEQSVVSEAYDLTKGTYYFVVERYNYSGNYDFKLSFTSAKESFSETEYGTNNAISTASAIKVNTKYNGQLAMNDEKDFYKVSLSETGKITLDATAQVYRIRYTMYDSQGYKLWSNYYYWNETTGKSVVDHSLELAKGTYYFVVEKYGYSGNYSFKIKQHVHSYKDKTTKATTSKDGKIEKKCSCGAVYSSKAIYYPKKIKLSATEYVYDGKVKKPTVTVKDSNGKVIKSSNYTVTYPKGRKNVGKYNVKVTFKGNYKGTATATFTIKPKKTSIVSLKAKSKGFTVKLKKQTSQTTGYQIQYSTSKSFSSSVTETIKKNTSVTKTITKLKPNKKYYVRVRTYKTVSGKKYYSDWSATKSVKTKK